MGRNTRRNDQYEQHDPTRPEGTSALAEARARWSVRPGRSAPRNDQDAATSAQTSARLATVNHTQIRQQEDHADGDQDDRARQSSAASDMAAAPEPVAA